MEKACKCEPTSLNLNATQFAFRRTHATFHATALPPPSSAPETTVHCRAALLGIWSAWLGHVGPEQKWLCTLMLISLCAGLPACCETARSWLWAKVFKASVHTGQHGADVLPLWAFSENMGKNYFSPHSIVICEHPIQKQQRLQGAVDFRFMILLHSRTFQQHRQTMQTAEYIKREMEKVPQDQLHCLKTK